MNYKTISRLFNPIKDQKGDKIYILIKRVEILQAAQLRAAD